MKLIIFDIDGTLTDTKKVDDICFIKAFDEVFGIDIANLNWDEFTIVTDWSITRDIVFKETGKELTIEEHDKMKKVFFSELLNEKQQQPHLFKEIPGALHFYNLIKNNPAYQVGVATGCWRESGLIKLDAIGIDPSDVAYANSDDFITRVEIVRHAIVQAEEKHGGKFSEIIYFGDGVWDYTTCKKVGIHFIGIDVLQDDKLKDLGTEYVFKDFRETEEILGVIERF